MEDYRALMSSIRKLTSFSPREGEEVGQGGSGRSGAQGASAGLAELVTATVVTLVAAWRGGSVVGAAAGMGGGRGG